MNTRTPACAYFVHICFVNNQNFFDILMGVLHYHYQPQRGAVLPSKRHISHIGAFDKNACH